MQFISPITGLNKFNLIIPSKNNLDKSQKRITEYATFFATESDHAQPTETQIN